MRTSTKWGLITLVLRHKVFPLFPMTSRVASTQSQNSHAETRNEMKRSMHLIHTAFTLPLAQSAAVTRVCDVDRFKMVQILLVPPSSKHNSSISFLRWRVMSP